VNVGCQGRLSDGGVFANTVNVPIAEVLSPTQKYFFVSSVIISIKSLVKKHSKISRGLGFLGRVSILHPELHFG
jgi:hypothetical protein